MSAGSTTYSTAGYNGTSPTATYSFALFDDEYPNSPSSTTVYLAPLPPVPVATFWGPGTRHEPAALTNPPRRSAPDHSRARRGFQQMARIPCYRGKRPR